MGLCSDDKLSIEQSFGNKINLPAELNRKPLGISFRSTYRLI